MTITAKTASNSIIEDAVLKSRASVQEGKPLWESWEDTKRFPYMVTQMVAVGEQTGSLSTMLGKVADFYDEEVDQAVVGDRVADGAADDPDPGRNRRRRRRGHVPAAFRHHWQGRLSRASLIAVEDRKLHKQLVFLHSIRIAILSALALVTGIILLFFSRRRCRCWPSWPRCSRPSSSASCSSRWPGCLSKRTLCTSSWPSTSCWSRCWSTCSGGIVSPFYFLYILPIIVASIFLSRRDTLIIATVSFIAFGTLSDLLYLELIPYYPGFEVGEVLAGDLHLQPADELHRLFQRQLRRLLLLRAHPPHRRSSCATSRRACATSSC